MRTFFHQASCPRISCGPSGVVPKKDLTRTIVDILGFKSIRGARGTAKSSTSRRNNYVPEDPSVVCVRIEFEFDKDWISDGLNGGDLGEWGRLPPSFASADAFADYGGCQTGNSISVKHALFNRSVTLPTSVQERRRDRVAEGSTERAPIAQHFYLTVSKKLNSILKNLITKRLKASKSVALTLMLNVYLCPQSEFGFDHSPNTEPKYLEAPGWRVVSGFSEKNKVWH